MDIPTILLFVVSASISFGIGRTIVHFRNKKKKRLEDEKRARMLRDQPPEVESKNKSKRKRQLQSAGKAAKPE